MYVEQPKRIRRMRRMRRKKEKRNGKTREASQQESSVEKNPRGRVLAGTVYSSSCGNFWFLVVQLDLVGLVWRWVGLGGRYGGCMRCIKCMSCTICIGHTRGNSSSMVGVVFSQQLQPNSAVNYTPLLQLLSKSSDLPSSSPQSTGYHRDWSPHCG